MLTRGDRDPLVGRGEPKLMTRFNWDRVRMENRMKQNGVEPFFEMHTKSETLKQTKRHHNLNRGKCPHCGKMKTGLTAHIAAKHSGALTERKPPTSNQPTAPPLITPVHHAHAFDLSDLQVRIDNLSDLADSFRAAITVIQNDLRALKNRTP